MRITLIILSVLVASSCTVIQKPKYIPESTPVKEASKPAPPTEQPKFITPTPATVEKAPKVEEAAPLAAPVAPSMKFSNSETEHIKFSEYNPFPSGSNTFAIDLDALSSDFTYPVDNARFSSGYGRRSGRMHTGVDLLNDAGQPIFAVLDGTVRFSKSYFGYGNVVVIRHLNGIETVYSHNSKNLVKVGDRVKSGDKIATVGRTGQATTNHLHFEVRVMGQTIDPALMLDVKANKLRSGIFHVTRDGSTIKAANLESSAAPQAVQPAVTTKPQPTVKPDTTSTPSSDVVAKYHTIVRGDTLYSLSRRYGTTVAAICKLNDMTDNSTLFVGRKLRVQ